MKNNNDFIKYVDENELIFTKFILKKAGVGSWIRDNRNDLVRLDENMISLWGMDNIWTTNEWLSFSQKMLPKIFGLSEPDLNKLLNVFSGKDPDDLFVIEHGITRDDGEMKNFEVRIEVHSRDKDGLPIAITGVNIDTTGLIQLKNQSQEIEAIHKRTKDSIEFASLIQQAILPQKEILESYTNDSFTIWQPKDIVGGDIYFIEELESKNEILIIVIDGAGHGVPGAFVTMLVKAIETQIVAKIEDGTLKANPSEILEYFNVSIKTMLKQEKGSRSNAGFDGGILYYNKATKECSFAGAKTDLYMIDDNKLTIINGDRKNVGFVRTKIDQKYKQHKVVLQENTKLYISTDGIFDQKGENKSRYGTDKFENLLVEINNYPFEKQLTLIMESFNTFKKNIEQIDDITIVGLNFK